MQEQQSKVVTLIDQIKRERVVNFPFYLVTSTYSHEPEYHFLGVVDYNYDTTVIIIYPFKKNVKLSSSPISLKGILTRKIVTCLHIISLKYKQYSSSVIITEAEFIVGHKSGQLALVQYNNKEKQCKMLQRFNRSLKSQGFLSKTFSFFDKEETYTPQLKGIILNFKKENHPQLSYSYQIGSTLVFLNQLSQVKQSAFLQLYEQYPADSYTFQQEMNSQVERGKVVMFGTYNYYSLREKDKKVCLIKFNSEVSSYILLSNKQLVVALGPQDTILILDSNNFSLSATLKTQMTIRSLNYFRQKEDYFLTIFVYDNYMLLYDLLRNRYCKWTGHRSFISSNIYSPEHKMLICAGMDHRISLCDMNRIKEDQWYKVETINRVLMIEDLEIKGARFHEIFSVGQFDNIRTNLHNYGFAAIIPFDSYFCALSYDAKIKIYNYK